MTGRSEQRLNNPMAILLKVSMHHMPKEARQQPAVCLLVALVTCLVHGIRRILRKNHESKASSRRARVLVTDHSSDP